METDKVNLEVPSPIDGVLTEISSKDGESVEVGALTRIGISQNGVTAQKKIIKKIEPQEVQKIMSLSLDSLKKENQNF